MTFFIRDITVILPTPLGTGVKCDTLSLTLSKSTSPYIFPSSTLIPTSITTALSLTISDLTKYFLDNFDANSKEITQAHYFIMEGNFGSKEYDGTLSFQFIRVPYDITKELNSKKENIERDAYVIELQEGKYRDTKKLINAFKKYKSSSE